jgi:hypothetical protein
VSVLIVHLLTAILFLAMLAPPGPASLPWTFPGDFRQRLRMSGLVVSGTIEDTFRAGSQVVDGTEVTANIAHLRVDRVFQGSAPGKELRFTWFTPGGTGYVWDGPPVADLRPGRRYMVFLKQARAGWQVSMPLFAIEVELAAMPPRGSPRDLSHVPVRQRYRALAEELKSAALAGPAGPTGMAAEPATYFSPVFDLLGGCAAPFYRRFLSSPDWKLRDEASIWLGLIHSRHLACNDPFARTPQ